MQIFLLIIIVLIVAIIFIYNKIVSLNVRCKNAWASIDNQLKRRADLIPNLVSVTKGYAEYESKTLEEIVNKRNTMSSISDIASNSKETSMAINNLFALTENYPELKANEIYKKLQIELTGTEDKIAYARQFYNDSVQYYNTVIMSFPSNIIATILKYKEKEYFKVNEDDKKAVEIKL